jgi:hypothetical protein
MKPEKKSVCEELTKKIGITPKIRVSPRAVSPFEDVWIPSDLKVEFRSREYKFFCPYCTLARDLF